MYASQQVCKIYVLRLFGIGIRSDVKFLNHFMEKPDKFSKRLQKSSSLLAVSLQIRVHITVSYMASVIQK